MNGVNQLSSCDLTVCSRVASELERGCAPPLPIANGYERNSVRTIITNDSTDVSNNSNSGGSSNENPNEKARFRQSQRRRLLPPRWKPSAATNSAKTYFAVFEASMGIAGVSAPTHLKNLTRAETGTGLPTPPERRLAGSTCSSFRSSSAAPPAGSL